MVDNTPWLVKQYASLAILDQKVQCLVTTELSIGNVQIGFSFLPVLSPVFVSLITLVITSFVILGPEHGKTTFFWLAAQKKEQTLIKD